MRDLEWGGGGGSETCIFWRVFLGADCGVLVKALGGDQSGRRAVISGRFWGRKRGFGGQIQRGTERRGVGWSCEPFVAAGRFGVKSVGFRPLRLSVGGRQRRGGEIPKGLGLGWRMMAKMGRNPKGFGVGVEDDGQMGRNPKGFDPKWGICSLLVISPHLGSKPVGFCPPLAISLRPNTKIFRISSPFGHHPFFVWGKCLGFRSILVPMRAEGPQKPQ